MRHDEPYHSDDPLQAGIFDDGYPFVLPPREETNGENPELPPPDPEVYGGFPPFVKGSDTSREAAASVAGEVQGRAQKTVVAWIRRKGGSTCDEVEVGTGLSHQTASAALRTLELKNRVRKTDVKRKTRSGRRARVYVVREEE